MRTEITNNEIVTYDENGRVIEINNVDEDKSIRYEYRRDDRISFYESKTHYKINNQTEVVSCEYNENEQLILYSYENYISNRRKFHSIDKEFSYDSEDRLVTEKGTIHTFDNDSDEDIRSDYFKEYTYDDKGRLSHVRTINGIVDDYYTYVDDPELSYVIEKKTIRSNGFENISRFDKRGRQIFAERRDGMTSVLEEGDKQYKDMML